jgi:hypothetical protein
VAFPGNQFTGEIAPALRDLVDRRIVRIIDLLFVTKDDDGEVAGFELSAVDNDVSEAFGALIDEQQGLLSQEDVDDVAESLDPGSSAAMLLFEHTWAAPLRAALVDSGGELVGSVRIPPEAIEEVQAALAAG